MTSHNSRVSSNPPRDHRAAYSSEVGTARAVLFREAFKRIDRSISAGFHLEAIAILESLICDRLEMSISIAQAGSIPPGNLGPLLTQSQKLGLFTEEFYSEMNLWRKKRNQVLHQMVKITNTETVSWRERMKFARETAIEGKDILKQLQILTVRQKSIYLPKMDFRS